MPSRFDVDEKRAVETGLEREPLLSDVLCFAQRSDPRPEHTSPSESSSGRGIGHDEDRRNVPTFCM